MKKLFIICVLTISNYVLAQSATNLKVSESAEYKDKVKSDEVIAIYTSDSGKTAIVRSSKRNFLFDIFDVKLKKTDSKDVKIDRKEKHVGDLFYNNQLKLFTVYAPKKDERILYCHTLNLDSKAYTKTVVFKTNVEKKQSLFGSRKNHNTSFSLSPNGNYFAIATDNIRKNKNSYTIRVFDAKTEKLIFKKAYQEGVKRVFEHNDLYVDNDANVYSLGKLFIKGRGEKKRGKANYQFILNKITKIKNTPLKLNLKKIHIKSLSISNINNELHLIGFYSELNVGRIKGGCNFLIDTDNFSVKTKKSEDLPKQVYEDLYGYRTAQRKNKKKKELFNFDIDYVLKNSNGDTYLIAEEFYVTQHYVHSAGPMMTGGHTQRVYHYDDILILKFNSDGDLAWGRSVFKRANSPSYNVFLKNDQLHVILNSGKNLTKKNDGRTKVSKGWFESSSLYDIEYAVNGDVSYNKIQNNKGNAYYYPYYGTYKSNKFIMMSSGKRKKTFMILE